MALQLAPQCCCVSGCNCNALLALEGRSVEVILTGFLNLGSPNHCDTGCEALDGTYLLEFIDPSPSTCSGITNQLSVDYYCNGFRQPLLLRVEVGCSVLSVKLLGIAGYLFSNNYVWTVADETVVVNFLNGNQVDVPKTLSTSVCQTTESAIVTLLP